MRFSEAFDLNRKQGALDFVDIDITGDTPVFIDPTALKGLQSSWGDECCSLLQSFFLTILRAIRSNNSGLAIELLETLHEPNETHLGLSKGRAQGRAIGPDGANQIVTALSESEAVKSGLLQDLEDTILMIEGIGPDIVSDITTNIIRGPLIKYTQEQCKFFDLSLTNQVDSGPIWNPQTCNWDSTLLPLPVVDNLKILLVPKVIVRHKMTYNTDNYLRFHLAPYLQNKEFQANTSLVRVLKSGERKLPYKTDIYDKYGTSKSCIVRQTLEAPEVLEQYREAKSQEASNPLTHIQIAELEEDEAPDWQVILNSVTSIRPGRASATDYEDAIEALFTTLFYPSLTNPRKQHKLHNGRKRVDITYSNEAREGFFYWAGQHFPASHIFIECKNYGREVGNPELDQLIGRFSPSRGKMGLLVCRRFQDKDLFLQRCIDAANDTQGFVIPLDDDDLITLVEERSRNIRGMRFSLLRDKFDRLINFA